MSDKPLIPKKLHYMWLGRKPVPDNLKKCIDSWKKFCPDYEIIEWNESNFDYFVNEPNWVSLKESSSYLPLDDDQDARLMLVPKYSGTLIKIKATGRQIRRQE